MKKQLIEQIDGLEQIIYQARQTKTNKILDVFKETFDLSNVEYSNLTVGSERAEFYFNEDRWGSFTVYFNEPWGGDGETKLEISTPSFSGTNASRLVQWGKIAEKIFANGDEFLVKLAFVREEHKKGIEVVFAKLAEAKNKLKDIEDKEYKADFILTKTALETVGRTFERDRWIQVGAQNQIRTNSVRIEKVKGAKTYNIHHINFNKQQVVYGRVREMYVDKLINELVSEDRKNA
jgi:hypothetical protein